jgi:environmental stress-induced protein Ves
MKGNCISNPNREDYFGCAQDRDPERADYHDVDDCRIQARPMTRRFDLRRFDLRRFDLDTLPRSPWKNGQGVTREISIGPQGADLELFDWRLTLADINPGPFTFSYFAGIDRTMVVSGPGMEMSLPGSAAAGMEPVEPYSTLRMAGEDRIEAQLSGAAITALNLMTRRGRASGRVVAHRAVEVLPLQGDLVVLVAMRGRATLALQDGTGETVSLETGQGVVLHLPEHRECRATCSGPDAVLVEATVRRPSE